MSQEEMPKNVSSEKGRIFVVTGLTLTALVLILAYVYTERRRQSVEVPRNLTVDTAAIQPPENVSAPVAIGPQVQISSASDPAIAALIEKVFKHIFLPSGDVRVETVVDAEKLRAANPVFYQYAKVGDKLLIYSDRAILYDPINDQVLDVMHLQK